MQLIDANILINATRDDGSHHAVCCAWLDALYRSSLPFGFTEMVGAAFLRTLTNPSAFDIPNTIEEANDALQDITSRREFMWLNAGHDHWAIFRRISVASRTGRNLVNDAWLAAIAIEANHELITLDNHFKRFPGLRWRNLLDNA